MRYRRDADALNPALDLGERDAFRLDLGDGRVSYPRNWPRADLVARLGFEAYEPPAPKPAPELQPEDVALTRYQLRTGLFTFFKVTGDQVSAMIAAIPDATQRELAWISWEDAQQYRFTHPLIGQIAGALSLTDEEVRAAWMKSYREEWG
jgi:hypothetical protein